MLSASLAAVVYLAVSDAFGASVAGAAVAFVVLASLLGKAIGLLLASLRLELLRRSLSRRAHIKGLRRVDLY